MSATVTFLRERAEQTRWCEARDSYWRSTGPERVYWRGVWRWMIHQERERLQRGYAQLYAATEAAKERRAI
jgi:predicted kinase